MAGGSKPVKIVLIGCGYVSEFYAQSSRYHNELEFVGAFDRDPAMRQALCRRWGYHEYETLDALLSDDRIGLVLNLTNPRSHYDVTKACLLAGKHVYSEKPLAMTASAADDLVRLARERRLYLASAPCSLLSETAQTLWQAARSGVIGKVRFAYGNFEDGLLPHKSQPWKWLNGHGAPWPAKDEFEVGCTFEHAGYILTWLATLFGPAQRVTAFASCQFPEKGVEVEIMAPDFSVGCLEYKDGVVARVTCSLGTPKDKSLTIFGDDGALKVFDVRDERAPVYFSGTTHGGVTEAIEERIIRLGRKAFLRGYDGEWGRWRRYPFTRKPPNHLLALSKPVDFCRGPAELVAAIAEGRNCRLTAELGRHVTELIEALQYPSPRGVAIHSSFAPIDPLPA